MRNFPQPGEFRLLKAFAQRPGRVLSREDLLTATNGRDANVFDRSIDMLIMRLRRKIEPEPQPPSVIVTLPGVGYKFAARVIGADIWTLIESVRESPAPASEISRLPERRNLTVLQYALSGPTFFAAQHDPEDLRTLLATFYE